RPSLPAARHLPGRLLLRCWLLGALLRGRVQIQEARQGILAETQLVAVVFGALLQITDRGDQLVAGAEAFLGVLERGVETEEFRVGDPGEALVLVYAIEPELLGSKALDCLD